MNRVKFSCLLTLLFFWSVVYAQDGDADEDRFYTISTPLTVDLKKTDEELVAPKKKKRKKNVFYGIKTKRGFAKKGSGPGEELIFFHYLKRYQPPDPYVRDIYWYDFQRKQIRKTKKFDPSKGVLLHGPFLRKKGDQIIEEGIFYVGTKHGRWVKRDKNDILLDKEYYYKGWPKMSQVRYYDRERTKIKEIIPIEYGLKEGYYYYFYENGTIAVSGEFKYDHKVGKWSEFYPNRRGRKKVEIQYRINPDDDHFQSYVIREWNSKGKVIYDHNRAQQMLN